MSEDRSWLVQPDTLDAEHRAALTHAGLQLPTFEISSHKNPSWQHEERRYEIVQSSLAMGVSSMGIDVPIVCRPKLCTVSEFSQSKVAVTLDNTQTEARISLPIPYLQHATPDRLDTTNRAFWQGVLIAQKALRATEHDYNQPKSWRMKIAQKTTVIGAALTGVGIAALPHPEEMYVYLPGTAAATLGVLAIWFIHEEIETGPLEYAQDRIGKLQKKAAQLAIKYPVIEVQNEDL